MPVDKFSELRTTHKALPDTKTAVGFGISSLEQAKYVSTVSDGVIIGSKLISLLETSEVDEFEARTEAFAHIINGGKL